MEHPSPSSSPKSASKTLTCVSLRAARSTPAHRLAPAASASKHSSNVTARGSSTALPGASSARRQPMSHSAPARSFRFGANPSPCRMHSITALSPPRRDPNKPRSQALWAPTNRMSARRPCDTQASMVYRPKRSKLASINSMRPKSPQRCATWCTRTKSPWASPWPASPCAA